MERYITVCICRSKRRVGPSHRLISFRGREWFTMQLNASIIAVKYKGSKDRKDFGISIVDEPSILAFGSISAAITVIWSSRWLQVGEEI